MYIIASSIGASVINDYDLCSSVCICEAISISIHQYIRSVYTCRYCTANFNSFYNPIQGTGTPVVDLQLFMCKYVTRYT